MRVCVWVSVGSYSSRNQEQSQEQRCLSVFIALFRCCYAVFCWCVPVSHCTLLTLWQAWYSGSRAWRCSFFDCYERCFCGCSCVRILWACHPEHEGQFQPTLALNFKNIRAVQQRHTSSSSGTIPMNLATLIHIRTPMFIPLTCDTPRYFQPTTSRRGILQIYDGKRLLIVSASVSHPLTSNFSASPSVSPTLSSTIDFAAPRRTLSDAYPPGTRTDAERDGREVRAIVDLRRHLRDLDLLNSITWSHE